MSVPEPPFYFGSGLNSVSCGEATVCEAVGWYQNSTAVVPMAESYK